MEYKNYFIENFMKGFTVFYMGDELFFDTIESAKEFIDSLGV